MGRRFAGMTPQQIREERECGIFEAAKLHQVSALLDRVEKAESVDQLRSCLADFITLETGIQ